MIAREAMSSKLLMAEITEPLNSLVITVKKLLPDCIVIKDGTSIIGIVRETGISKLVADETINLSDIIEKPVATIAEDLFVDEAIQKFATQCHSFLVVVDQDGIPTGYLSPETLLEYSFREIVKLSNIIKAIPVGVLAIDKHGSLTIVNAAAERMLNISAGESIGQHISRTGHNCDLLDALRNEISHSPQKSKQGDLTVVVNRNPIQYRNKVIGAVEVFQDISDFEELSNELQSVKTLNEELETIIRSSFDEIFVTDGLGITIKVSDSVSKNCGVPAEYFIGRSVEELENNGLFYPSAVKKAIANREIVTVSSITNIGKQIITTATPVFNEQGELVKVVCNIRDLTELSQLKKRLEYTENMAQNYRMKLAKLDSNRAKLDGIIGISSQLTSIKEMICKIADLQTHVFITGESGVGKGIVARSIHATGQRANKPLITINCGAIPDNLIESEFFGYEPGAFTGARVAGKKGLVELASGGTLFLDEIAEMPFNLQVKLLAFIQDKKYLRVGGDKEKHADVRIIAATNKDPRDLVANGKLREDLYYRLNVVPLHIPALRSRREDIQPLIEYKLNKLNKLYQTHKILNQETLQILICYDWPGNVRELENVLERIVITSETYEINPANLPDYIRQEENGQPGSHISVAEICTIEAAIAEVEKQLLSKTRSRYRTTAKMAEALGVNQSTIVRKLKRYNLS